MKSSAAVLSVLVAAGCAQAGEAARSGDDTPAVDAPRRQDAPDQRADAPNSQGGDDAPTSHDAPLAVTGHLVINEVDYDQVGSDTAEFIELYNPTTASISLSTLALQLVNGANNTVYGTVDLSAQGPLAAGAYLVIAGPNVSAANKLDPGWTSNAIQNGSPDGMALVDTSGPTVVDALSYAGAITAAQLTGFGSTVSLVEGTATTAIDSNTTSGSLCRQPNGADTDDAATDWAFCATPTPGASN